MTELMFQASPGAGLGASMAATMLPIQLGPLVVLALGLVMIGWFLWQMFFKTSVPLDTTPADARAAATEGVRRRFHPRASDLLPRPPRN
ncbi:MAG: hypothetical protein AB7K36_31075 [Chloroflexota bacterium]